MLVKDIPDGAILWDCKKDYDGENIVLGIKGLTLPEKFYNYECKKIGYNPYDWEIIPLVDIEDVQ